jgi:hypothetical protein
VRSRSARRVSSLGSLARAPAQCPGTRRSSARFSLGRARSRRRLGSCFPSIAAFSR